MHASPKGVILLDDERSYLDLLTHLLEAGLECPVHAFLRADDAFAAMRQLPIGICVTDYYMPEINGLDLIARAQKEFPQLRFVMITGHGLHLNEEEALAKYPALKAVLHKPFSWRVLADTIRQHWPDHQIPPLKEELDELNT